MTIDHLLLCMKDYKHCYNYTINYSMTLLMKVLYYYTHSIHVYTHARYTTIRIMRMRMLEQAVRRGTRPRCEKYQRTAMS